MPALVIDHESRDATAAIARARGARVVSRTFTGFVDARRFALQQVLTPWTLMIDADEALDEQLQREIIAASGELDGYYVRRTTFFCEKPMRLWTGERLLRIFKTASAHVQSRPATGGAAQLHEFWRVNGRCGELDGILVHDSYPTLDDYRQKFREYTDIEARGLPRTSRASLLPAALFGAARFAYFLFVRGSLLDGWRGVYVAFFSAFYALVVRYKALVRDVYR